MKNLIFLLVLINTSAFSSNPPNSVVIPNSPLLCFSSNIIMSQSMNGNSTSVNFAFASMEDLAKKACDYKIKPQSITVSLGFVSATWETDKLCK